MFPSRHIIKLSNRIPRDISRRLYTMTSERRTGRLEDTIREKVYRFLMTNLNVSTMYFLKLTALLQPASLAITNDSWQHRHHTAMREQGGGSGETRMLKVSSVSIPRLYFDIFRFFNPSCFECFRK